MSNTSIPRMTEKRRIAVLKAQNRGKVAEEWLKTHKIDSSTIKEFQALMRKADKEFVSPQR